LTARRRLLAAVTAGLAAVTLTGCERPAPIVTVVSGMNSEWKEADVFCFEGQSLEQDSCVQRAEGPVRVPVTPGERVGIDVSKAVKDRGWFIELSAPGGQEEPQRSEAFIDQHYFGFTAPQPGEAGLRLTVRSFGEDGPDGPPGGEWTFDLVAG
jgi:hypothetical protein